jgi:hypothetical protein
MLAFESISESVWIGEGKGDIPVSYWHHTYPPLRPGVSSEVGERDVLPLQFVAQVHFGDDEHLVQDRSARSWAWVKNRARWDERCSLRHVPAQPQGSA